jgi:hypothetical protein
MNSTPAWIPYLFGSVIILMAALILGAVIGIVPTEGGQFLAPPIVVISIGVCLLSGGLAMWIPQQTPALIKSVLLIISLATLALVCNWTAFAPGVVYHSSTSIGFFEFSGESQFGSRIAFGLAAILVDIFILSILSGWVRSLFTRIR